MSVTLKIADIQSTPTTVQAELSTDWCADRLGDAWEPLDKAQPVTVTARRAADVVDVDVQVRGRFAFPCSRCAARSEIEIDTRFEHHFVGPGQLDAGSEWDAEDASRFDVDPDVSEHDGVRVELDELCIEHTILALPDVPLCAEACLGLCPQCGVDRNTEACDCIAETNAASPWEALRRLKLNPGN